MADGYALAMQAAIVAALKTDVALKVLVGTRVYGRRVPNNAKRPYIWINKIVVRDLRSDCAQAATVTFGVEAVSRDVKAADVEASRCAQAANAAFINAQDTVVGFTLAVAGFNLVQLQRLTETSGEAANGKDFEVVTAYSALLDG